MIAANKAHDGKMIIKTKRFETKARGGDKRQRQPIHNLTKILLSSHMQMMSS